ncbi:MAG: hypothetical protein IKK21_08385, partial [Clostridia bacterium]|nr:hypothetical protein [Clostridia bacterium]
MRHWRMSALSPLETFGAQRCLEQILFGAIKLVLRVAVRLPRTVTPAWQANKTIPHKGSMGRSP